MTRTLSSVVYRFQTASSSAWISISRTVLNELLCSNIGTDRLQSLQRASPILTSHEHRSHSPGKEVFPAIVTLGSGIDIVRFLVGSVNVSLIIVSAT